MEETLKTRLVRFEEGDEIFKTGDTSREMYIIRSGSVSVYINKDEKLIHLTRLYAGHYIGEMSFLTGIARTATVIAESSVMASMITPDILSDNSLGLSNWAVSIAKVLVRRIRKTTEILGNFMISPPENKSMEKPVNDKIDYFEMSQDISKKPGSIFLKGILTEKGVEQVKKKIRELKLKQEKELTLDFSGVIDIDQAGMNFLLNLTSSPLRDDLIIKVENIQLIRDKVLTIKGIQDILTTTAIPTKRVESSEILIRQGDPGDLMYVVKTGSFSVYRETSVNKVKLADAKTGDVIGEMSLIKQGARSATVKADQTSVVYVIDIREFYNNIYNIPDWFLELIQGLVQRLRDTNEILEQLVDSRKTKIKVKKMVNPFCIMMDGSRTGEFHLKGNLTINNMLYLKQILKLEIKRESRKIVLNLSQIRQIDKESILSLLNIYTYLKTKNIKLELKGPQKSILNLFRQYGIEE